MNLSPTGATVAPSSSLMPGSSGNATGSGRTKVALKPGHSLMDWIRMCKRENDLSGVGVQKIKVTADELGRHKSEEDCWLAIHGLVFNVTPYLDFHPGGRDELMRGAGKDATDLFNQVHGFVNFRSMLQKCLVGDLVHGNEGSSASGSKDS